MRAEGSGALDLRLVMPLRKVADTTVKGEYRFSGNRLWLVDGVPPLDAASGRVSFTEKSLAVPEVRAQALGEPMRLVARTEADGSVHFEAAGAVSVSAARAGWRQAEGWPVLDHLSGSTPWKADIRVGRGGTRVLVSSELDGISTSLPAPFNKSANESWPLRVEFAHPRALRAKLDVNLADRVAAQRDAAAMRHGVAASVCCSRYAWRKRA